MKSNFFKISFFILAIFVLSSCEKKVFLEATTIDTKSSLPIANASVTINGKLLKSDREGRFKTEPLKEGQEYLIKIEHPDYVSISRFFTPAKVDSSQLISFPLLRRAEKRTFNTTDSIEVKLAKGIGYIEIPPTKWQTISKSKEDKKAPFEGEVNLQVTYLDPTNSSEMAAAPAPLLANGERGRIPLQSYGMLEIFASDSKGNRLDISERNAVRIELPSLIDRKENTGLYTVSSAGIWTQVGELSFNEETNTLLGSVSSISEAWNADEPCSEELVCVKIKFVNSDETPASIFFYYRGLNYQTSWEYGFSDSQGIAELYVCPGQVFQLFNQIPCCDASDIPGTPEYEFCCVQNGISVIETIDLSGVTLTPPCTDLGIIELD